MENRLIYRLNKGPDIISEAAEFTGDGEKEYRAIRDEILGYQNEDLNDPHKLGHIVAKIFDLHAKLFKSERGLNGAYQRGEFFLELFGLIKDRFELKKALVDVKFKANFNREKVIEVLWMADPDNFAKELMASEAGKWDENLVIKFATAIVNVGTFYSYRDPREYEEYIRANLKDLHDNHYDLANAKNKRFKTWLTHQKDHFEHSVAVKLDWLSKAGRERLASVTNRFRRLGSTVKNDDEFQQTLVELGDSENSTVVSEVLMASGLPTTGSSDRNSELFFARPKIYTMLAWAFYQSLLLNPNATREQKALAYETHNAAFANYPELKFNYDQNLPEQRAAVAEEVAGNKGSKSGLETEVASGLTNVSRIPDLNLGVKPSQELLDIERRLFEADLNFGETADAIIAALENGEKITDEQRQDLVNKHLELRRRLREIFGIDQIAALNPDIEERTQAALDYYELFALALQNAAKLPIFREQLDRFSTLGEEEYAENFAELEYIVQSLRFMSYLPPEAVEEKDRLLVMATEKYQGWALLLGLPPRANTSPSPFVARDREHFYNEESNEYRYSPLTDLATGAESLDEAVEIPEVMDMQLNRIRLIESLAISLLAVNKATDDDMDYVRPILDDIGGIETALIDYYQNEEYDGKTPFNLDAELAKRTSFSTFLAGVRDLLAPGQRGPVIRGTSQSQFEKFVDKKHGMHDLRNVGVFHLRKSPFYDDLLAVLQGSPDLTRDNIKRAGAAIVSFQRNYLDDYITARALMAKLLQPHMPKSRENVPEDLKAELRAKAHVDAVMQVAQYMRQGGMGQIKSQIRLAYLNQSGGGEPSQQAVDTAYYRFFNATVSTQTEVLYDMFLNHAAISFFDFFGKPDAADLAIHGELQASLGLGNGIFKLDDDTKATLTKIASFGAELLKELVYIGIAVLLGAVVGGFARGALGLLRLAKFLQGATRLARLARAAYEGIIVVGGITAEAAVFLEIYPGMKGEEMLHQTLTREGVREASQKLLGEMALFGAFHALHFVGRFLKQGASGRALMQLAVRNPTMAPYVEKVFTAAGKKNADEALAALNEILAKGVRFSGSRGLQKLPREIAVHVEAATKNLELMRERYFRLIQGLPSGVDSNLRKLCGFLLQDLQFDVLAMVLGTAAKHGIYAEGMKEELDITNAETWFQMYTMAAAFRGGFTVAKIGMETVTERAGASSPFEKIPAIREQALRVQAQLEAWGARVTEGIIRLRARIEGLRKEAKAAISAAKREAKPLRRTASLPATQPFERQAAIREADRIESAGREQAAKLRTQVGRLEIELRNLERSTETEQKPLRDQLAQLRAQEAELEVQLNSPRELGNFVVPSRIAQILPGWLREHFYGHYVDKQGRFIGSDGLVQMLTVGLNGEGFARGLDLIATSKRLLLSVNQVLFVASKLSGSQRTEFLRAAGKVMSRRQRRLFMTMVKTMGIDTADIPPDFLPDSEIPAQQRRSPLAANRYRLARWQEAMLGLIATGALSSGAFESRAPRSLPERPAAVRVEAGDFRTGGKFAPKETEVARLKPASATSELLLISTEGSQPELKEWEGGKGLFSVDHNADQSAVNAALEKAGAGKDAIGALNELFGTLPDEIKPYVRIFAAVDGNQVTPYLAIDQEGLNQTMLHDAGWNPYGAEEVLKVLGLTDVKDQQELLALMQAQHPEIMQAGIGGIIMWFIEKGVLIATEHPLIGIPLLLFIIATFTRRGNESKLGAMLRVAKSLYGKATGKESREKEKGEVISPKDFPELLSIIGELVKNPKEAVETDFSVDSRTKLNEYYKFAKRAIGYMEFKDPDEGIRLFKLVIKNRYIELRIKELEDLLEANESKTKWKGKKEAENELEKLREKLKAVQEELVNNEPNITGFTAAGEKSLPDLLGKQLDGDLRDKGFTPGEIKTAKDVLGELLKMPGLNKLGDALRESRELNLKLKFMAGRYNKALSIAGPGITAPDPTAPLRIRERYLRARDFIETYEALKQRHEDVVADIKPVIKKLEKIQRILPKSPVRRRLLLGALVWALVYAIIKGKNYFSGGGQSGQLPPSSGDVTDERLKQKRDEEGKQRSKERTDDFWNKIPLSGPAELPDNLKKSGVFKYDASGKLRRKGYEGEYFVQPDGSVIYIYSGGKKMKKLSPGANPDSGWKNYTEPKPSTLAPIEDQTTLQEPGEAPKARSMAPPTNSGAGEFDRKAKLLPE